VYIRKDVFSYFKGLYKSFDEERRKRFLNILVKQARMRIGEDVSKIRVVGDEF
jgi:hypothetical protein